MSQVQTESPVQVTPPPTFGDLEAKQSKSEAESNSQPNEGEASLKQNPNPATAELDPAKPNASEKPEEKKAEGEKKADGEKSPESKEPGKDEKPVVPEKYDLKLSENSLLDKAVLERIAAQAKAQGLTQEQAQDTVKAQENYVAAFIEDRKAQWHQQTISDKEIGGDSLKENITLAKNMLDRFASPSLKEELTRTGYGNHPEMVRMLVKIGKASANDKAIIPNVSAKAERSTAELFYDKTP